MATSTAIRLIAAVLLTFSTSVAGKSIAAERPSAKLRKSVLCEPRAKAKEKAISHDVLEVAEIDRKCTEAPWLSSVMARSNQATKQPKLDTLRSTRSVRTGTPLQLPRRHACCMPETPASKGRMLNHRRLVAAAMLLPWLANAGQSQCDGTVSQGRIEGSVKFPLSGTNFSVYRTQAATAGRTHLHAKVASIVVASYKALAVSRANLRYVYGEVGWPAGGKFAPHRTHQNGLSVDFFVPVRDSGGRSVSLPTNLMDRWGYDVEFNEKARYGEYSIDFEAMAEHLYHLDVAAKAAGSGMALVIFDRQYLPRLFATHRGDYLKWNLPFMKGKSWVRHDEHYHVDFVVPCKPKAAHTVAVTDTQPQSSALRPGSSAGWRQP